MNNNTGTAGAVTFDSYCPICGKPYCYFDPIADIEDRICKCNKQSFSPTGWICPRCGKVNAPWVSGCNCPNYTVTISGGDVPVVIPKDIQGRQG